MGVSQNRKRREIGKYLADKRQRRRAARVHRHLPGRFFPASFPVALRLPHPWPKASYGGVASSSFCFERGPHCLSHPFQTANVLPSFLNRLGSILCGMSRIRHTGESRYPESPTGFRVKYGMTAKKRRRYPAACGGVVHFRSQRPLDFAKRREQKATPWRAPTGSLQEFTSSA